MAFLCSMTRGYAADSDWNSGGTQIPVEDTVNFAGTMIPGFLKISQNAEILYFIVTVTKKVATVTTGIRHYDV